MQYSTKNNINKSVISPQDPRTWPPLLLVGQVSQILNVTVWTLRQWDKKGTFKPSIRVGNRNGVGDRRYKKEDVIRAMLEGI